MNELDLAPCGTLAAVRRHYRRGEPIDRTCRQAEARDWEIRKEAQNAGRRHRRYEVRKIQRALDQVWAQLEADGWRWPSQQEVTGDGR